MEADLHGKRHRGLNKLHGGGFILWASVTLRVCLFGIALAAALAFFPMEPASAHGKPVRIENISPAKIEAEPLQVISTTFRVINQAKNEYELEASVNLPEGWQLASSLFPFSLKPGEEKYLYIAVSIPRGTRAGKYAITAEVSSTGFLTLADEAEVEVDVIAVARIEITPLHERHIALPGEIFTSIFTVTNRSNASSRFEVEVKFNQNWEMNFEPGVLDLEPGESEQVIITTVIPEDITREEEHSIRLTARSLDLIHGQLSAKSRISTMVYPRLLPGELYYSLPGTGSMLGAWNDDGEFASQIQIDLQGDLGEGRYGEFRLVEPYPTRYQGRRFIQEDTFFLKYGIEDKGFIMLGDNTFNITPLTERYYYGRGIDFEAEQDMFTFRAFAAERRGGWMPGYIAGAQVTMETSECTELTLTAMTKSEDIPYNGVNSEAEQEGRSITLIGSTKPAEGVVLIGEVGVGDVDDGETRKSDGAYRIAAEVETERFRFDGELIHTGDYFPGYWQGSEMAYGYLSYDICPDFTLWGNLSKNQWGYSYKPDRPHPESIIHNIGANINAGDFGRISVYRRRATRTDINLFEWDEEDITTNIQLSKHFDDFSLTSSAAFGTKQDKLVGTSKDIERYQLMFNAQPWENSMISGGYRWDIESASDGSERHTTNQLWLNADIRVNDATNLVTRYNRNEGFNRPSIEWLRADLKHEMNDDNSVQLTTQWRGGDYGNDLEIAIKVTFPLNVPLPWLPKSGWVEGMVYIDAEKPIPLEGVIVSVDGMSVVTDKDGHFIIAGLDEGDYELVIDRGSIGLDRIPDVSIPVVLIIAPGETIKLEIPIVDAVSISGRVVIRENGPVREGNGFVLISPAKGFSGVTVILTGEDMVLNRVTDISGRFRFTDLRPGHWTLMLLDYRIPEHHIFEPIEFELELLPGESLEDIEFLISPTERPMEITITEEE